ncbi:MAG: hypothetical protein HYW71_03100 [Candidatus Niyogibacteria bacterium]|nr:hypothetical protein [Candidatus Niyogibacteria bacterium]
MQYAWFVWSLILLGIWTAIYFFLKQKESRREMLLVSFWSSVFGLTEPLFVPSYWSPPSLFDLAHRTGFDIESFIFMFGVAGIAAVVYERIFPTKHQSMPSYEMARGRHRYHAWAILSAPIFFFLLYFLTDINPIYSTSIALMIGGIFAWYCRPDLKNKMIVSAFLFTALYFFYFLTLIAIYPGYVQQVWNLSAISGILIFGIPLEEYIFAFSFGFIWSSVYEHIKWYKIKSI